MNSADHIQEYMKQLPEERFVPMEHLRMLIKDNLPAGFEETMSYGMISYVIPHSIYPSGYHVNPKEPIPFISLASQKNYIALYHMGIYLFPELLAWFQEEYSKHSKYKLDMGKSCIRFKRMGDIPYQLIGELCTKIAVEYFLSKYETVIQK